MRWTDLLAIALHALLLGSASHATSSSERPLEDEREVDHMKLEMQPPNTGELWEQATQKGLAFAARHRAKHGDTDVRQPSRGEQRRGHGDTPSPPLSRAQLLALERSSRLKLVHALQASIGRLLQRKRAVDDFPGLAIGDRRAPTAVRVATHQPTTWTPTEMWELQTPDTPSAPPTDSRVAVARAAAAPPPPVVVRTFGGKLLRAGVGIASAEMRRRSRPADGAESSRRVVPGATTGPREVIVRGVDGALFVLEPAADTRDPEAVGDRRRSRPTSDAARRKRDARNARDGGLRRRRLQTSKLLRTSIWPGDDQRLKRPRVE